MNADIYQQLPFTLDGTAFPNLGKRYRGKVRDTYALEKKLLIITSDRLSAFDRVLTTIPFKGQILNRISNYWFEQTQHIVANHIIDVIDDNCTLARRAEPFKIEFVIRGYLTGSLARDYADKKDDYALRLPKGLKKDQAFESPILTPSTKAPVGEHDEPIAEMELVRRNLISSRDLSEVKEKAFGIFRHGQKLAQERGLILVDTKYEFGMCEGKIILIDEVHTPDSSRYWVANGYQARFDAGENQIMLDKENIRQWLLNEKQFKGVGPAPVIPDNMRVELAQKYVNAFEALTADIFPLVPHSTIDRVTRSLQAAKLI
jgi:phosphoribosylaminoimidazole-succinocarboxamide synthase